MAHNPSLEVINPMRPDKSALDIASYPFTIEIPTRFGDMDPLNHINNVAIAGIFEESRVRFGLFSRGKTLDELRSQARLVTVATTINYLSEVLYPEPLTMAVGIKHIGRTSYSVACLMLQYGKPVAYSVTTLVRSENGKSTPLPELVTDILAKFVVKGQ